MALRVQHVVSGVRSQVLVLGLQPQQHLFGPLPATSQTSAPVCPLNQTDIEIIKISLSGRIQRV